MVLCLTDRNPVKLIKDLLVDKLTEELAIKEIELVQSY